MIIGLTGTNAAGKTTVANFFIRHGFAYYSLSDEIREIMKFRNTEINRDNLIAVGNEMRRKFGKGYLAERALRKIRGDAVVDSIRNLGEIDALKKSGEFILISLDAPAEARYSRAKERGRTGEGETLQEFMEKEQKELKGSKEEQQIEACMLEADFSIINASNIPALYWRLETIMKKAGEQIGEQKAELG